ncbi:MAG: DUF2911 domain-containing protein [Tenacibaculum sp.]
MKKTIVTIISLIIFFLFSVEANAQKFPKLDKSPMDVATYPTNWRVSDKLVKVTYSRPKLKRRSVIKLAPYGKIWRTGANEATEITFYKDVVFGDKNVKAGRYTLFTIPGANEWTVILSTAKNVWGSYFYKDSEDVVRVIGSVSKAKKSVEAFSIAFEDDEDKVTMYLGWGKTIVSLPIKKM